MRRFVYDYYTVAVPGDMLGPDTTIAELGAHAICEARERATLYCTPAVWTAKYISGDVGSYEVMFRVCRKRNYSPK